jgi:hypothetical protein
LGGRGLRRQQLVSGAPRSPRGPIGAPILINPGGCSVYGDRMVDDQ